jgi:glycosyltransferase involved in cell wall biosynthesis
MLDSQNPRVRIAHLGPHPSGKGGMPAVMRALLGSRLGELYALEVIPTYDRPEPLARLAYFLRGMLSLVRWCAGRGSRIVHIHTTVRGSLYRKSFLVAVATLMRRPVVLHLHAGAGDIAEFDRRIGPARRALFRRAFRAADRVLSVSQASADEVERRLGPSGVLVVPNAAPPSGAASERRNDNREVKVLYLGGFANPAKGGAVLAEALPALVAECPAASVTLAGPGEPPASLRPLLEGGRVHWCGWLDEPLRDRELGRCDIFVLPSVSEGMPVALLEAMSWGLAIVASRVGGVPEVLSDGMDGVLVEPGRADEMVNKVAALAGDAPERARLGAAARTRAERLNSDEVCGRLDAIYRELVP